MSAPHLPVAFCFERKKIELARMPFNISEPSLWQLCISMFLRFDRTASSHSKSKCDYVMATGNQITTFCLMAWMGRERVREREREWERLTQIRHLQIRSRLWSISQKVFQTMLNSDHRKTYIEQKLFRSKCWHTGWWDCHTAPKSRVQFPYIKSSFTICCWVSSHTLQWPLGRKRP